MCSGGQQCTYPTAHRTKQVSAERFATTLTHAISPSVALCPLSALLALHPHSHRTGTRAGFVEKVITSADDIPADVFGGRSYTSGRNKQSLSSQHPAYLIRQEKDDTQLIKGHDMCEAVKGDAKGASREEIVEADKETKAAKRSGKQSMEERSVTLTPNSTHSICRHHDKAILCGKLISFQCLLCLCAACVCSRIVSRRAIWLQRSG